MKSWKLLKLLPPEAAHSWATWAMRHGYFSPGSVFKGYVPTCRIGGQTLPSPVGLAAGYDKEGALVERARDYGFGWVEVGSVTRLGGPGNLKPRLFRVRGGHLVNRMGLNGPPADVVLRRIVETSRLRVDADGVTAWRFAVSIARSNREYIVGDAAIEDVLETYRMFRRMGLYTALNLSCPNCVAGIKVFDHPPTLSLLLASMHRDKSDRPLFVKLPPPVSTAGLQPLVDTCVASGVDGFILGNTSPARVNSEVYGGLSGPALLGPNLPWVNHVVRTTGKPVIACGGVRCPEDVRRYLDAGAIAVQAYTGFVRGPNAGPDFVHKVLASLPEKEVAA